MLYNLITNSYVTFICVFIQINLNNCYGVELPQVVSGMFRSVFTITKTDLQNNDLNLLPSQISDEISLTNTNGQIILEDINNFNTYVESTVSENMNLTTVLFPSLNITNSVAYTNVTTYVNSLPNSNEETLSAVESGTKISIVVDGGAIVEATCNLCAQNVTKLVKTELVTESGTEVPITELITITEGGREFKIKSVLNEGELTTASNIYATVTGVSNSTEVMNENNTEATKATDQITFLVANCGVALLDFRRGKIIGGVVANPKMFPWVVNVLVRQYHICAGTIITETFVLTAAHCLVKSNPRYIAVRSFAGFRRAKKVFVNPGFWLMNNDIGLIQLAKPYEHLSPSCISNLPEPSVGVTALILGWGLTYEGGQPSDGLLAAEIQILPKKVCEDGYKGLYNSDMICAGSPTGIPDTCHGDSGGPLLKLIEGIWYQIGIVSFGDGCGRPTTPGVYTKVELYLPWIKNILEEQQMSAS